MGAWGSEGTGVCEGGLSWGEGVQVMVCLPCLLTPMGNLEHVGSLASFVGKHLPYARVLLPTLGYHGPF